MTFDQRKAKGKILCEKLAEAVAKIAPNGIGLWDRCWEVVDPPSATFMSALSGWEVDPSDVTMQRVSRAYDSVMAAWGVAVAEYAEMSA